MKPIRPEPGHRKWKERRFKEPSVVPSVQRFRPSVHVQHPHAKVAILAEEDLVDALLRAGKMNNQVPASETEKEIDKWQRQLRSTSGMTQAWRSVKRKFAGILRQR